MASSRAGSARARDVRVLQAGDKALLRLEIAVLRTAQVLVIDRPLARMAARILSSNRSHILAVPYA